MPLQPGDRIERYVVDALLGCGGMGEVYRAHDPRLERSVALKILRGGATGGGASGTTPAVSPERMLREARAAAALDHPNVVAIFDVGQVDSPEELRGTTYIAMELVKGRPMRDYVGDRRVPVAERVRWLTEMARALAAAHAKGLVHRDVKPENAMIREDGLVKMLDFGIAKRSAPARLDTRSPDVASIAATLTEQGLVLGTPPYMAPEQMRGEPIDGRADQFSWGVVAYELLSGSLPWSTGGGAIALVAQILSSTERPLLEVADVPPHVAAVVKRALAKDRDARFPSMDALLAALTDSVSALAETLSAPAVPPAPAASSPPAPTPTPRTTRARSRRPLALAATIALLASAGVVAIGVRSRPQPSQPAATAAAAPRGCVSNWACSESHGGEPYVCRFSDHACVPLASEDCTPMYEPQDLLEDDTVWLGAMLPTSGAAGAKYGTNNMQAADLARREISRATAALRGAGGAPAVRRIAIVGCDDGPDAMRAARHLVEDVGVPAIVGFGNGRTLADVAGSLLIPRGVLTVATLTTNPEITQLPQPPGTRLVWRASVSGDALADAAAHFVPAVLEPRASRPGAPTRVVLAHVDSIIGLSFARTFYRQLVFNGKSAVDNGGEYQEVTYVGGPAPDPDEIGRVADRIAGIAPTVVVIFGAGPAVVKAVEARWKGPAPRPTYAIVNDSTGGLAEFLGARADRRRRLFSIVSFSSSPANAHFVIRFNELHKQQVTRPNNPGTTYDAVYLLAYATFALGGDAVSGPALARSFARLQPPGRHVEVGPPDILAGVAALSAGEHIDLEGTASDLDFDLATGEDPGDFSVSCPGVDRAGRATGEDVESGVMYRARTREVEGTLRCP